MLVWQKGQECDGWVRDSATYEKQAKRGLVSCTHRGSAKIEKQIRAPGLPAKSNRKSDATTRLVSGPVDPRAQAMMQMMRDYRKHVEANAENVGNNFAEEARTIHYKETQELGIYGNATLNTPAAVI